MEFGKSSFCDHESNFADENFPISEESEEKQLSWK